MLLQWGRADPLLHPVLGQAERGLMRLGRTTERLEALGYQLTATKHHREDGCTPGPAPGERIAIRYRAIRSGRGHPEPLSGHRMR